jgi:hypothetical protein
VPPADVGRAEHANAAAFDVDGASWSDRIVRRADTGRLDLTPRSAGLLAACLGYSRMFHDDLQQLDAGNGTLRCPLPLGTRTRAMSSTVEHALGATQGAVWIGPG